MMLYASSISWNASTRFSRSTRRTPNKYPSGSKRSSSRRGQGSRDHEDVLKIKGLIRETEARAGALACGVPAEQCIFMDLRFYRTGTIAKNPIHPKDIDDIAGLFDRLQPSQIYVAGELSDPHGTHRVCAEAIFEAVHQVRAKNQQFEVWLYRGAWEELATARNRESRAPHDRNSRPQEVGDLPAPVAKG